VIADFVQELYLKELKAYKPSPAAKDAHAGQVKSYSTPTAPKPPSVPDADTLAKELEAYDNDNPTVESPKEAAEVDSAEAVEGGDEYLKLVESDVKSESHH